MAGTDGQPEWNELVNETLAKMGPVGLVWPGWPERGGQIMSRSKSEGHVAYEKPGGEDARVQALAEAHMRAWVEAVAGVQLRLAGIYTGDEGIVLTEGFHEGPLPQSMWASRVVG